MLTILCILEDMLFHPSLCYSILFYQNVSRGHNNNDQVVITKMTDPVEISKARQVQYLFNFFSLYTQSVLTPLCIFEDMLFHLSICCSILFSQSVGRGHIENSQVVIMKMTDPVEVSKTRHSLLI